jgi:pyrroline-5-carboxylate reductase
MNLSQSAQTAHLASMKLGIIGGGVMAEAILARLLSQGVYPADRVIVSDISDDRRSYLQQTYQVTATPHNLEVAQAQTVILAIKPQILASILAGVSLDQLEKIFKQPVIRVMPNTPVMVGCGMTALAPGQTVLPQHLDLAQHIFAAVGEVTTVPEAWMDAVTGLSGSGPAFVAIAVEALTDGGVAAGLPRAVAAKLALQTVRGTTELMIQKDLHPALLKDQVTSPGGTTIAGVASLEASGFRAALIQAVQAAYRRSQELGRG